jgi:uncharacterized membrane protein YeaQ/YmgE (transglycosylase-associated protein family)
MFPVSPHNFDNFMEESMSKQGAANVVIYALAGIGLIIIAPSLLSLTFGLMGLIIRLVLWMFAGALAGRFLRGEGYGLLGDIGLGVVGGLVGTFLLNLIGLGGIGNIPFIGGILVGAIGAVAFVYIARLFDRDFAR